MTTRKQHFIKRQYFVHAANRTIWEAIWDTWKPCYCNWWCTQVLCFRHLYSQE